VWPNVTNRNTLPYRGWNGCRTRRPAKNLEELNALFAAWLEQGYHHRKGRETAETLAARFARGMADIRLPDPARLAEVFLWQEERRVDKTGQLSLQGRRYEVDPHLAGTRMRARMSLPGSATST